MEAAPRGGNPPYVFSEDSPHSPHPGIIPGLAEDFEEPPLFKDFFTQSAGLKSAADWPIFWYVGGHATGTNFHSHPNAYNALIFGKKHW